MYWGNGKLLPIHCRTVFCIKLLIICLLDIYLLNEENQTSHYIGRSCKEQCSRDCIEMPISANHNVKDFDNHNVETQEQSSALAYKTPRESQGTGFQLSN